MKIKFTRSILVASEHREEGSTLDVTDEMGAEIIALGAAEVAPDEPAADEPAAKKAKK